jgi:hypothetical protein
VFFFGLDDLAGRVVDNADDQAVPDVSLVKDQALFDLMLVEHAEWLAAVRAAGMLG